MTKDKTYYRYEYTMGDDDICITEVSRYDVPGKLNDTHLFINNLGKYRFFMYSDAKNKMIFFIESISEYLENNVSAASRLYQSAKGRFLEFNAFCSNYK